MRRIGKKGKIWIALRKQWIKDNPPDEWGLWTCYLQIHPWCPKRIDRQRLTLDHEEQGIKRSQSKLSPACVYCNGMKGSRSYEQIKASLQ